jgi:RimJ/RimL family protein N-acetyltransferase
VTQHHLILRTLSGPDEIDLFNRLPYSLNREVAGDLEAGRRHPNWLWVALDGDRLAARAGFWSRPGEAQPMYLDIFDTDGDLAAGERLLKAALASIPNRPEYTRFIAPQWRDDPDVRRGIEDRMAILETTGAKLFVERLRLKWEPGTPIPAPTNRLSFHPADNGEELIALMTDVLTGTLDVHSREELTRMTPAESARQQYHEELTKYPSPREWWQIARRPNGAPVGFVIPGHNGYNSIIAYIAVVPAARGNGYINEILAEGTRILAAQGASSIRAATDVGNTPMAQAFTRAGYQAFEHQIDMTWPNSS